MKKVSVLAFVLLLCISEVSAQGLTREERALADKIIELEKSKQELVGVAVALIKDNKIVYVKGFGHENKKEQIPVTGKTLFRWASISKPVTAVTALQLWEQGLLDLDADVRDYVPEFPKRHGKITTRQLLCHQSGIVHYSNGRVIRTKRSYKDAHPFKNVIHALDRFKDSPLVHRPGEKFAYTTHGYILLSAVVQRAGKKAFAAQCQSRVFSVLDMKTMRPDYQWEKIPHRAVGYRKTLGKITQSTNTDVSWKLGGGGFVSNVEDLGKFAVGLMTGQLLEKKSVDMAWQAQKTSSGKRTRYGLGFTVSGRGKDLKVGHSGAQEKTRTYMSFYPKRGIGVVVMTNSEYGKPGRLCNKLWAVFKKPAAKKKLY
ncbi:MAG: serine hydrolase [Planctomycetota bacterium]|nr:serine hydrolase [Planctomycetota bacterium]